MPEGVSAQRFSSPTEIEEFSPSDEFLALNDETMAGMTEDDFRRLFRRSAVKRAKYAGLMRNFEAMRKYKK